MKSLWKPALPSLLLPFLLLPSLPVEANNARPPKDAPTLTKVKAVPGDAPVQVALLLDTSGSMEGLIDQARCQLWNVVSELSKASREGAASSLEIAVYQYGSELLAEDVGFIRQVTGFTDDLDEVSKALFSLKVKGGEEFCSQVIDQALTELDWNSDPGVYKAVFIAGNESFDQGEVTFGQALPKALGGDIFVNSIYCFDPTQDPNAGKTTPGGATAGMEQWEAAAKLTGGRYFQIDHNHHLPDMATPHDERMRELNERMNETFVWFGPGAEEAARNQKMQDANVQGLSDHAFAARMSAKIGHLYHHVHHDLVDAIQHGTVDLDKMPEDKMPPLMQKLSPAQRMEYLDEMTMQRQAIRRQMADVIASRHRFLEEKMSESLAEPTDGSQVLGGALVAAIREQAQSKGYAFKN